MKVLNTIEENAKWQKEMSNTAFKRDARQKALGTAIQNKPSYYGQGLNQIGQMQQPTYNLLDEAEKIYQWLIKDL